MTLTGTPTTATGTAPGSGPSGPRRPEPGRDRATFRDYLSDKVDTHLAGLTAAHAVDEANGDVLDALIDQTVAQQEAALEWELLQEATDLRRREQTAAVRAETVAAQLTACETEQAAHAGRVRALRQRLLGGPGTVEADAPVNPGLLRAFIEQERQHWETAEKAALRSARLRDTSRLPAEAAARQRQVDAAAEDLAAAQARAVAAEQEVADAVADLRGEVRRGNGGTAGIQNGGAR